MDEKRLKTKVVKVDQSDRSDELIIEAAQIVLNGGLVVFPTETVYGIMALADDIEALKLLSKVKDRPLDKPYTIHLGDKEGIKDYVDKLPQSAKVIINNHWPGPVTMLINDRNGVKQGFRLPDNITALRLIREVKKHVVGTSANIGGRQSPVNAEEVIKQFQGRVQLIIDEGATKYRKDSTIVDCTINPPKTIRKGAINLSFN